MKKKKKKPTKTTAKLVINCVDTFTAKDALTISMAIQAKLHQIVDTMSLEGRDKITLEINNYRNITVY